MLNKSACADLPAAGLQQATQQDLAGPRQQMAQMCTEMRSLVLEMCKHRSELVYWMIGMYFGTMLLAGALLALAFKGMVYLFYLDGKLG